MNYFLNHSTTVLLQFSEGRGERKEEERILTGMFGFVVEIEDEFDLPILSWTAKGKRC